MISKKSQNILWWTCALLLLGRAWQHLFWDAPYRTIFWEQDFLEGLVNFFGVDWNSYVTSAKSDQNINRFIFCVGCLYAITAFSLMSYFRGSKLQRFLLVASGISLFILSALYWKEKFYHLGQWIEYAGQVITPFLFLYLVIQSRPPQRYIFYCKIALALTFIGHGFYAIGIHPQPGYFIDMCLNVFPIGEDQARLLLKGAGVFDFVFAIGIFIPPWRNLSLWYMIIWGFVTALARITAHLDFQFFWTSMNQWCFEFMVRVPHFALAYVVFLYHKEEGLAY